MLNYKLKYIIILLIIWLSFIPCQASADVLQMKNGERIVGFTEEDIPDKTTIIFRSTHGLLTIKRSRIALNERETPTKSWIRLGDEYTKMNQLRDALAAYQKALDLEPGNQEASARLRDTNNAINKKPLTDDDDVLTADAGQITNQRQMMDLLSRARSAADNGRFEDAEKYLDKVSSMTVTGLSPEFTTGAAKIYVDWGLSRADHQDINSAIDCFKRALQFDPDNQTAQVTLKKLIDSERSRLVEFEDLYKNDMTADGRMKYADVLFKQRRYAEALPIVLEYTNDPANTSPESRRRALQIYEAMHKDAAERGDWEDALKIYNQLLVFDPSQPRDVMFKYEYMIRRQNTRPDDINARLALARFAESNGMLDTARQEYESILEMQEDNADAKKGLLSYAGRDLREVQTLMASGNADTAREKAAKIVLQYPMFPEVVQAAQSVLLTAQVYTRQDNAEKQQQAQQLVAQGNQYYNTANMILLSGGMTTRDANNRIFSIKQESINNLKLAINSWQQALKLDSSLRQPEKGNLAARIRSAQQRIYELNKTTPTLYPLQPGFKKI